jgi:hypothetical protein
VRFYFSIRWSRFIYAAHTHPVRGCFSSFTFVNPTFVPESKKKNAKECGGILR